MRKLWRRLRERMYSRAVEESTHLILARLALQSRRDAMSASLAAAEAAWYEEPPAPPAPPREPDEWFRITQEYEAERHAAIWEMASQRAYNMRPASHGGVLGSLLHDIVEKIAKANHAPTS